MTMNRPRFSKRRFAAVLPALALAAISMPALAAELTCPGDGTPCRGSDRADVITGQPGDDVIRGGNGDDHLTGGAGADRLVGGSGADTIQGGEAVHGDPDPFWGIDLIRGGAGDDAIFAEDGVRDTIDCGKGRDTVFHDKGLDDVAANCERVKSGSPV